MQTVQFMKGEYLHKIFIITLLALALKIPISQTLVLIPQIINMPYNGVQVDEVLIQ